MNIRQIQESREQCGVDSWGGGYFGINDYGDVVCYPTREEHLAIPLPELVEKAREAGITTPMILRFPQIIKSQLTRMHQSFIGAGKEYNYKGRHFGVFPFKVNQRREFIDAVVSCGRDMDWGLEVGSKTEFAAALSYPASRETLLICNGFKDIEFVQQAFLASSIGRKVVLVVEGPDELQLIIDYLNSKDNELPGCPEIGIRVRLYSKGSGKWEKSSGETSKFGLTTIELLHALQLIEKANLQSKLTMLHFHIGSQITAIKRFKNALKEAARVYAKVVKMGFSPTHLNIGGGVGVDYDGSQSSGTSSANYSMQEFANDAVYVIGEVCNNENVPHPNIVTESGRIIAAYHSVVVADIREVQGDEDLDVIDGLDLQKLTSETHKGIKELEYIAENMNKKNYGEYYHDAVEYHEELFTLFNLGYVSLLERAIADQMFQTICRKALYFASFERHQTSEFEMLQKLKVSKYLANFSIFQSIPDSWSIDQLFPVIPLARHGEKPSLKAEIVDITCDSDGCIDRFIDRTDDRRSLDLHSTVPGEPYLLGFFLVGAYQESLSNEHNLFGAIHEVEATMSPDGEWNIDKVTEGDPIDELLACRNYDIEQMRVNVTAQVHSAIESGILEPQHADRIIAAYSKLLRSYPYLTRVNK